MLPATTLIHLLGSPIGQVAVLYVVYAEEVWCVVKGHCRPTVDVLLLLCCCGAGMHGWEGQQLYGTS
jgi:hypothetical protein